MAQAYDFALEKMGLDLQSYPIWSEYVTFLKSVEAQGTYAENQKITAIRKVFQRGVINPMMGLEQLWKDYVAYEQNINPIIAEKMTGELSKEYMSARRVAKEMEIVSRAILDQVASLYERAIAGFMKKNPLVYFAYADFEEERNQFEKCHQIYQKFLDHEDIDPTLTYIQYLRFARRAEGIKSARAVFKKAREDSRSGHAIYIASAQTDEYVTFLKSVEAQGTYAENQKITAIRKVFQRGVINPMMGLEQLWKDYVAYEQNINPIIAEKMTGELSKEYMSARRVAKEMEIVSRGDMPSAKAILDQVASLYERAIAGFMKKNPLVYFAYADFEEERNQFEKCHQIYQKFLDHEDIDPTLTYIQYLRFARRAEGIKSARAVFKKAREDSRSGHAIYIASAQTEYYCSREPTVALKVFELGLKKFGHVPEYVLAYVDHLTHLNEDNNTRVLMERVLSSGQLSVEDSIEVWNRFLEFECRVGDLSSVAKVDQRRKEALSKLDKFKFKGSALLVDRYKFGNLYPCDDKELKAMGYIDTLVPPPLFASFLSAGYLGVSGAAAAGINGGAKESRDDRPLMPDTSQMLPFKPKIAWVPGDHPIDGGEFPIPPSLVNLCRQMPPPGSFTGPFVISDALMDLMMNLNVDEFAPRSAGQPNRQEDDHSASDRVGAPPVTLADKTPDCNELSKQFELAKSVHWVVNRQPQQRGEFHHRGGYRGGRKRPRPSMGDRMGGGMNRMKGEESDEEDEGGTKAPSVDIFRERLAKKLQQQK
ncbi:unnamed protein product [Cyprideis torosa]|uniref:Suppressor of forked domain-containing protein n=1 Tax=Cyprideis torosa TaxID=163714 RepID=A0A7R8WFK0_9CRUS|nr:unnamed protein product [Cyprideis torosa]CAG0891962.1 unnamed protein product [Cyprideis torosa]